ncbi:MAG: hypothetical protein WBP72_10640 [Rhodocyclaceae bacterium]|jgi:hypothetical protein
MPDIDRRALYRETEQRWPSLAHRVVFFTGDRLTLTVREFVDRCGCTGIEKLFLPAEVRNVVAKVAAACEH